MKYIFIAGAPGSKWSSVSKNIYFSDGIDRTDASPEREYYHDAPGTMQLMHMRSESTRLNSSHITLSRMPSSA